MKIFDRLPIYDKPALIEVQGEVVQVWRNQAIVWVSFAEADRPFPAILDTGHSHNFSISRRHLDRWGAGAMTPIGHAKIAGRLVPRFATGLFLHRNVPGTHRLRGPHRIAMDGGIAVIPDDLPIAPRLPLLGIQAILANGLRLVIDGRRREVTLRTGWF